MNDGGYYVTAVRRGVHLEGSGHVTWLNSGLTECRTLMSVPAPIYPRIDADKVFGGKRGFRGIRRWRDRLIVATFDSLLIADLAGRVVDRITHPLFSDLQGIEVTEDGVWVTSTGIDALLKVDWKGCLLVTCYLSEELWEPGRQRRVIARGCDFRKNVLTGMTIHPNYVSFDGDRILVCCRRPGRFAELDGTSLRVRWRRDLGRFVLPHDGRIRLEGGRRFLDVCETGTARLRAFEIVNGGSRECLAVDLARYGALDPARPPARKRTNWLRGLRYVEKGVYLAGQAPARIVIVKPSGNVETRVLDDFSDSSIFDIAKASSA